MKHIKGEYFTQKGRLFGIPIYYRDDYFGYIVIGRNIVYDLLLTFLLNVIKKGNYYIKHEGKI